MFGFLKRANGRGPHKTRPARIVRRRQHCRLSRGFTRPAIRAKLLENVTHPLVSLVFVNYILFRFRQFALPLAGFTGTDTAAAIFDGHSGAIPDVYIHATRFTVSRKPRWCKAVYICQSCLCRSTLIWGGPVRHLTVVCVIIWQGASRS